MTFLWPGMLWLLLAVPALVALYVWLQRRKRKGAVRYASLDLVHAAIGPGQRLRRHVPPALFLLALIAIIVAIARPTAVVTLPTEQRTIVMAIYVSLSMRAADVEPTRLAAAQVAAKAFVRRCRPTCASARDVVGTATATPTQPGRPRRRDRPLPASTAHGHRQPDCRCRRSSDEDISIEQVLLGGASGRAAPLPSGRGGRDDAKTARTARTSRKPFTPVAAGSYPSGAIILLTDGRRTTGPDPLEAAKMVAEHGVRHPGRHARRRDGRHRRHVDLHALRRGGAEVDRRNHARRVLHAGTAEDLKKIYQDLNKLVLEKKATKS
jgi:Ca-activated chloride channel family protein